MCARLLTIAALVIVLASQSSTSWIAAAESPPKRTEPPSAEAASPQSAQPIDERAKQILDKAASNLMAIGSIEFRAEEDMQFSFPPGVKDFASRAKDGYLFRCDGDMWRVDEFLGAGPRSESYSFNGKMFQFLSAEFSAFRESKHRMGTRPQVIFGHPISRAYQWVFPQNGFAWGDWSEMRDRGNWTAVATRAKYIGQAKPEAKSIVTVELPLTSKSGIAFVNSINFDTEHGFAPASWSSFLLPNRKLTSSVVVKRWTDFDNASGPRIWLPVEVSIEESARGGISIRGTVRVVEGTLHINQPIAEEVFTLPRSAAKHDWGPYGLDEKTADFFKTRGPLAERLAIAQDDARLNHQRVLVIFGDPDAEISQRLFELREKNWRRALYEYQQLPIGKNDAAAIDEFRKRHPEVAEVNWPSFVVLDEQGKALDWLTLASTSAGLAQDAAKTEEFLHRHALQSFDAERLLADALAKAKQEDKKIFLQETGIYCAPCRRLSRFFEKHASILDQHFVYLKIDPARSTNGPEVIKRLRTDGSVGIPWIAILDRDGKVVTTELGFPSHEAKVIDEFIAMFSTIAPRMTVDQLKELRNDLEEKP